jgi:pyrroloquinoline-quinone synthase
MNNTQFFERLEATIGRYDLLGHPFYRAWSAGELSRQDLREYARHYYHHVHAFPGYLAEFALRLDEGELRRAVLANMVDEKGTAGKSGKDGVPHAELWLDFAEGMGARREMHWHLPVSQIGGLMRYFHNLASDGTPEQVLAAFYVYESQVPRIAQEKERGLRQIYGADDKTCGYFALHASADVYHSKVWREQLAKRIAADPEKAEGALHEGENAGRMLWQALDGIETARLAHAM